MNSTASRRQALRRSRPASALGVALASSVILLSSACGGNSPPPTATGDPVPSLDAGGALSWQARPTIVQTVRLLNPGPRTGDSLRLESRLRNVSSQPVSIEHVVCELDIEGDLVTEPPLTRCVAHSLRSTLAPGEEVFSRLERRIASPPGRYTVTIRHLLDPAVWVPAQLTVRP